MVDVSIIIINYNTSNLVFKCVESIIEKSKYFSFEIIIVNNSSEDKLEKCVLDPSLISIINLNNNLGTTKANNIGARMARGKYIFFLNPDTLLINNAIYYLKTYLDDNQDVSCVGGNLYSFNLSPCASHVRKFPTPNRMLLENTLISRIFSKLFKKKLCRYFNYSNKPLDVFYVSAADMMIRKELFFNVGGWDERVFMYGEEVVLGYKLNEISRITRNIPAARIIHLEGSSSTKESNIDFSKSRFERFLEGNCRSYQSIGISPRKYLFSIERSTKTDILIHCILRNKPKVEIGSIKLALIRKKILNNDPELKID